MTLRRGMALALVVLLVPVLGCRHEDNADEIEVKITVDPDPPRVGPARLTLLVKDHSGKPLEGATLKLEGNMAHAGMKPVFADAREDKDGRYRAELEFTMGGDWFILIEGKRADGRPFRKKIDLPGVRSE